MASLLVQAVGPQVTIQDRGRPGLARYGVPASGPMDRGAYAIAQAALRNPPDAPAIEVSLGGLSLDCLGGPVTLALAGGGFAVTLAGQPLGSWRVATLRTGDRLTIRPGPWGSWTYLAFAGTLAVTRWLGSAATHGLSNLGGGRLSPGQVLQITDPRALPDRAIPCPVFARPRQTLAVIPGPQQRFFAPETLATLLGHPFALTDAYDRMGVRLAGPGLTPIGPLDMPSEPIPRGAIQVAGDGVATVLLADHQTTGGYPKIATITADDLDGFAQLRRGMPVGFVATTPAAAVAHARSRALARRQYLARLAALG